MIGCVPRSSTHRGAPRSPPLIPLGEGTVLDPFAGAASTLAAAEAVGYRSIGIEKDARYFDTARDALPKLRFVKV
jgi:site-specific DNA-methyltransferase (adenine-specific)